MAQHGKTARVRKIAVLRANALGDYVFCLPALDALKNTWPDAELVYLGRDWHRDFLDGRPGPVDRVVVVPRCQGMPAEGDRVEDPAAVEAFFLRMQAEHFDLALQMHGGGGNSNRLAAALGARRTAGLRAEGAPALDINVPYTLYHCELLRYLEVAAAVGAQPVGIVPRVAITAMDRNALASEVPDCPSSCVILHPGATDIRRRWPAASFARLADELAAFGIEICVTGTAEESAAADAIVAQSRCRIRNLCGRLSLRAFAALIERAALVVANDTGPLHLARAVGAPTVGIYWVGNAINYGLVTATGHRIAIAWTTRCPACGMDCIENDMHVSRGGCDHAVSFVGSVSAAEVVAHARAALGDHVARNNGSPRLHGPLPVVRPAL